MKTKNFSEMSVQELQKQEKTQKFLLGLLIGIVIALLCINVFLAFKEKPSSSLVFPLTLLPIVILNWNTLKQIKTELKSRNGA
ncbi:MAG: redox-active disulfide protein 2 [Spirosomataceae bacterium]